MIGPVLEEIAQEQDGRLIVAKANTDENPEWAIRLGVQGIPTMLFVAGGEVVDRQVGVLTPPAIKARAEALVQHFNTVSS